MCFVAKSINILNNYDTVQVFWFNYLKASADSVDDTVAACNIHGVVSIGSEGLFSNNNIIDEVLADGVSVLQWSSQTGKISRGDGRGGNLALDNVKLENIGSDGSLHHLVSLNGSVDRGKDGERSSSGQFVGNSSGLKGGSEFAETVVSLKVILFFANGNTFSTPDLSRSLKTSKRGQNISSASSRGGSSRGGSSGCCSSRGGSSGGSSTSSLTHLQVFLETGSFRDGFTGILVDKGIRITGISHTSGSDLGVIEQSNSGCFVGEEGGEGRGASHKEGKGEGDFL